MKEILIHEWTYDKEHLENIVSGIINATNAGLCVLIHCQAGIDRAPFAATVFLALTADTPVFAQYGVVARARPQTIIHHDWATKWDGDWYAAQE